MTTRYGWLAAATFAVLFAMAATAQAVDEHHPEDDAVLETAPSTGGSDAAGMMGGMMGPQMMQMMQTMMPQMMREMMPQMMGQMMSQGMMPQMGMGGAMMGAPGMPGAPGMMPQAMMSGPGPMAMMGGAMAGWPMMPAMPGAMPMMAGPMGPMGMMMGPMGPQAMGQGFGPAMIYGMPGGAATEMTEDDVRARVETLLAWHGNLRLAAGAVRATETGEILADIVTVDGSLVQTLAFDRRTGTVRQLY